MDQQNTEGMPLEPNPELISLEAANVADLSCPGCRVSPVEE